MCSDSFEPGKVHWMVREGPLLTSDVVLNSRFRIMQFKHVWRIAWQKMFLILPTVFSCFFWQIQSYSGWTFAKDMDFCRLMFAFCVVESDVYRRQAIFCAHIWRFPQSWGYPQMVGLQSKIPMKMDDDWGYPHDYGNPHLLPSHFATSRTMCKVMGALNTSAVPTQTDEWGFPKKSSA